MPNRDTGRGPRDKRSRQSDLDWLYGVDANDATRIDPTPAPRSESGRPRSGAGRSQGGQCPHSRQGTDRSTRPAPQPRTSRRPAPDPYRSGGQSARRPPRQAPPPPRPRQPASRPAPHPRKRRHPFKTIMVLLLAWLVWLVAVPSYALSRTGTVDATPDGPRGASHPGTLVLLVGTDERQNLTTKQQKELGTGTEGGVRTDTMLLLYMPPQGKNVLISLPRDSYLPIPGHNRNKLNAAYSIGGAKLLVQTIEKATDLRINGYVEIGFSGFVEVVDAVGGVEVTLDKPMVDKDSHTNLPAGTQTLDGVQALGYVRMRKADPEGDLGRVKRQQKVASQVAQKAISPWTFINPVRYWNLNMAASDAVKLGTDTSTVTTLKAARGLMKVSGNDGIRMTVPVSTVSAYTSAGSSVLWNDKKAAQLWGELRNGDTSRVTELS
ncbi:LCP family protein [Cutibacterium sp. V970]|uniref:LCP family protein n=1 Tax=Cutibacterium sp. V970 TaxID=3446481 RepID=UPI003EE1309D